MVKMVKNCCQEAKETHCSPYHIVFLLLVSITLTSFLVWVTIHEYSHAWACWLTGGNMQAHVFDNEGGITMYDVSVAVGVSLFQLVMLDALSLP
jgi:hypothetical protein